MEFSQQIQQEFDRLRQDFSAEIAKLQSHGNAWNRDEVTESEPEMVLIMNDDLLSTRGTVVMYY